MVDGSESVVAENGTVVEPGGIYLTFSGDDDQPYRVAKVVSIGGGPGGAAVDKRLTPDLKPVLSPDLWLKLFRVEFSERPNELSPSMLAGEFKIVPVSVDMFLAWGPPKFPVRLGTEAVTTEELAALVKD